MRCKIFFFDEKKNIFTMITEPMPASGETVLHFLLWETLLGRKNSQKIPFVR